MTQDRGDTHPFEQLAFLGLGALLAADILAWSWAGLAGVLVGSGWPSHSAGQMAATLVRLPRHLSDPRLACHRRRASLHPSP